MKRAALLIAIVVSIGARQAAAAPPDRCAECHKGLPQKELSAPVADEQGDIHGKARTPCVTCHGGNAAATKGNLAHSDGFVARPKGAEAAAICARCHEPEARNWRKSPHATATTTERRASCVTCHGAHGVRPASLNLIAEPLCSSCHPIERARRVWKAVVEVEDRASALESEMRGRDGDIADLLVKVQQTRSDLRGLSHSLDLIAITRKAAEAQVVLDKAQATATPRLGARRWGTMLRWAGLGLAAAIAIGVGLLIGRLLWRRFAQPVVDRTLEKHGRRPLVIASAVAGVILIICGVIGLRGYNYVQHSPDFCTSCHLMDSAYDLWKHSGHKNIECHACHESDVVSDMRQMWIYATQRPTDVIRHAYVRKDVCEGCHNAEKSPSKWNQVLATSGHQVHVEKEKVACVQCHAASLHRFIPTGETCKTCHVNATLTAAGGMGEMHCAQCHQFLTNGAASLSPPPTTCIECHDPKTTEAQKEGHAKTALYHPGEKGSGMQWACGKCHKPHSAIRPSSADCAACHKEVLTDFPAHEVKQHQGKAECVDCHPPHSWKSEGTCQKCHGAKVPQLPE